jgi:hypothetical protein
MFASLSKRGEFIVKLPRSRVDALVETGDGVRFDPGHGRLMKEWLAVCPESPLAWESLANEALNSHRLARHVHEIKSKTLTTR